MISNTKIPTCCLVRATQAAGRPEAARRCSAGAARAACAGEGRALLPQLGAAAGADARCVSALWRRCWRGQAPRGSNSGRQVARMKGLWGCHISGVFAMT